MMTLPHTNRAYESEQLQKIFISETALLLKGTKMKIIQSPMFCLFILVTAVGYTFDNTYSILALDYKGKDRTIDHNIIMYTIQSSQSSLK